MKFFVLTLCLLTTLTFSARAGDDYAIYLSNNLQTYHAPFGPVFTSIYQSGTTNDMIKWIDFGDSALWTGAYLAGESFRYKVTQSEGALNNVKRTLEALRKLSLLGNGVLARHFYPSNGPLFNEYLADHQGSKDLQHVVFEGQEYYFMTNVSRDQYAGVFFGLAVAFDFVDDEWVHSTARDIITRLTDSLIQNNWTTYHLDGSIWTMFIQRPEQILSILQVARHANPSFNDAYNKKRASSAGQTWLPIWIETLNTQSSYFKFNVDEMYLYNLVRLEEPSSKYYKTYQDTYSILQKAVRSHQNAFFNIVELALRGPNTARDTETKTELEDVRVRGLRHLYVDNRGKYKECKPNVSCDVIPVRDRVYTDFLWQRSPFDLFDAGDDRIESPGVDYILPYWMMRYYEANGIGPALAYWLSLQKPHH